jgi:AcrR family transcriptional regulator
MLSGMHKLSEGRTEQKDTRMRIIEVAERLFQQIGFQKTVVADIARELRMSPANVYRFFANKSEINEAVCLNLLGKIETEAKKIAASDGAAAQKVRNLFGTVETILLEKYRVDPKLYDLIEASMTKKWESGWRHTERMTEILEQIIASGMASGEFATGDAKLAARLVNTACLRFRDPRLIVEYKDEREPTLDRMVSFCLLAIGSHPHRIFERLRDEALAAPAPGLVLPDGIVRPPPSKHRS